MKAEILKSTLLPDIPSVSGVEVVEGMIYMIGDNSPFLFCFDPFLNLKTKVKLYEAEQHRSERVLKASKAGLWSMTSFKINGYNHLVIFGSGNLSPQGDKGFLVKLPTPFNRKHLVWERTLKEWYDLFRLNPEVVPNGILSIEAAAMTGDLLSLLNRETKTSSHSILTVPKDEFVEFIQGHTQGVPFPSVIPVRLSRDNGLESDFSGATIFENKVFICISGEDTTSGYDDGPVGIGYIGVGVLPVYKDLTEKNWQEEAGELISVRNFMPLTDQGRPVSKKIKAIAVFEALDERAFTALAIVDNNETEMSEILLIHIEL